MKKLMTSLLAVLLCGLSLCWAQTYSVMVSVGCSDATATEWSNGTVTFTNSEGLTRSDQTNFRGGMPCDVTVSNIPSGTYTLTFEGVANGKNYLHKEENVSVTENLVGEKKLSITATPDPNVSLFIRATYTPSNGGNTTYLLGATITCKEKDNAAASPITATTSYQQGTNQAIIKVDASKSYTITATATGYKEGSAEWEANSSNTVVSVAMEPVMVTVSGTLKLGEETVSELPEGLSLVIKSNGTNTTATISETGYTVKCQPGLANIYVVDEKASYDYMSGVNLAKEYSVTTPENGQFTIADNETHTMTQNIVIAKTASKVTVQANPDDKIGNYDLTLTTADNKTIRPTVNQNAPNTFIFNGVPTGTHTLVLDHFGLKIKEGTATVTVAETLEDVTKTLETEAAPATVKFTGKVTYRDKTISTWEEQPQALNGATVKLYAAKQDEARNDFPVGEAIGTATVAEDGTFSISAGISQAGSYIAEVTHEAILPTYSYSTYVSNASDKEVSFNALKMIWVSGEVTNHDVFSFAGLTLTWNGEIVDGYTPETKSEYNQTTGKYYVYVPGAGPMPGPCTLNLKGADDQGFLMAASEEATITSDKQAVTKNLTAVKNADSGYMTVRLRYHAATKDIAVAKVQVFFALNDGTENGQSLGSGFTDANGDLKYLVGKDNTYKVSTEVGTYSTGYAAMKNDVNGFVTVGGTLRPNDTTIFMDALPIPGWIKLTGTVTLPEGVEKLSDLGDDLQIAVQTERDLAVMTSAIKNDGTYTIDSIPVPVMYINDGRPLFLAQTGGQMSSYGVEVPYNYGLDVHNYSLYTYEAYKTSTVNVKIVKIACNVSGTVSPAKSGQATLTKQGETEPSYTENIVGAGTYKFQGVAAGTYTLKVNCAGYEPVSKEVTVAATLEDVTVDAITLEAAAMDVTVVSSGPLGATNPKGKWVVFEGAEASIWNSDNTQELAKATVSEFGYFPSDFTFQATAGTKVNFKMTHPSIEPVSKEYTVTGDKLTISSTDFNFTFVDEGEGNIVMTGFDANWNATFDSLKLTWTWPEGADGKINTITLSRKLSTESGNGVALKTWVATGDNPHQTYAFAADELPVAFTDTVTRPVSYTYMFYIIYADNTRENVVFTANMRDGDRYNLTYTVNDAKMGTISSYQAEGKYVEGDMITVTAVAKDGYKFVEFLQNDQKLSEAERAKLTLYGDTVAVFGFKMPAEDVTVKAVFASKDPDAKVEYTVTLVSGNEAWGTVEGAGKFEEGTEIEVKATAKEGYKFVAWKEGDKVVSEDATYKFKVEKDITLTAVFEEKVANENLKAAQWAIFAEDGAIVIKGINGDRYDIYDLNGRLCGAALCTGAEIRMSVATSKLYIVRRLGADGSFDAKKIVVR